MALFSLGKGLFEMSWTQAPFKKYLALLAFYFVLALVLTYPLALNLTTHIPGHDTDGPAQTWSLWWTRYALLDLDRAPFTTDYLFYPLGLNLVAYTPVFLNGILSIPLQLAFGVVPAQNVMVWFALVSGAFGAYLFARAARARVSGENGAAVEVGAVLGGALYGFGAWHLNYVVAGHFMLISSQWLPYYALYLLHLDPNPPLVGADQRVRPPEQRGADQSLVGADLRVRPPLRVCLPEGWQIGAWLSLFLVLTAWTELTFVPFLALLTLLYLSYLFLAQRRAFVSSLGKLAL